MPLEYWDLTEKTEVVRPGVQQKKEKDVESIREATTRKTVNEILNMLLVQEGP